MLLRRLTVLLVFALAATACGDDTTLDDVGETLSSVVTPDDGPGAPAGDPGTGEPGDPGAGDQPGGGGQGPQEPPPATAPGDGGSSVTDETPSGPAAPGPVGSYATFYLRPSESEEVLVDVHSQAGAEPSRATLDHLSSVLSQVSGKAVPVETSPLDGGGQAWTAEQIRALGDANGPAQSGRRAVLRLFYLRGSYADDDSVVGVAVRSDVAAVFSDKVDEAAGVLGNPGAVEDAVSLHELGHILGLVDLVVDTGRADPDHPGHSPNRESVMYFAVESTLIGTLLDGGPPRQFDDADLRDLATIRNG